MLRPSSVAEIAMEIKFILDSYLNNYDNNNDNNNIPSIQPIHSELLHICAADGPDLHVTHANAGTTSDVGRYRHLGTISTHVVLQQLTGWYVLYCSPVNVVKYSKSIYHLLNQV